MHKKNIWLALGEIMTRPNEPLHGAFNMILPTFDINL